MGIILSSLFKIELSVNSNNIARIINEGVKCLGFCFCFLFYSTLKDPSLT